MSDGWLRLLGVGAPEGGRVVETALAFHGIAPGWALAAAACLAALVWWTYRRAAPHLSGAARLLLGSLRALFLFLLVALLLAPVLAVTMAGAVRPVTAVLVDGSASMRIQDARREESDRKRAALALGRLDPAGGLAQALPPGDVAGAPGPSRLDLVRAALSDARRDLIGRLARAADVELLRFGRSVEQFGALPAVRAGAGPAIPPPPAALEALAADSPVSPVGDAVRDVLLRHRGQPLAAVVLVTDGAANSGSPALEAAALARREGVPLHIWGVGVSSVPDLSIPDLLVQEVVFAGDEVPVAVRVRGRGTGERTAEVTLALGDAEVARGGARLAGDGEAEASLRFTPKAAGEFDLEARVAPVPGEPVVDNNRLARRLRVVDARMRVLLVDAEPRWEFRYLLATLLRDRRVELKCVLLDGDEALAQDEGSPYLAAFPPRREDLFRHDVVILGDVDPKRLGRTAVEALEAFVSEAAGGLVFVAGRQHLPRAYAGTPLETVLPVEWEAGAGAVGPQDAERELKVGPTDAGRRSAMMRLASAPDESAARWQAAPAVYWVFPAARARPAAEVLLSAAGRLGGVEVDGVPVLAVQPYGRGQSLFVGTDQAWRWRRGKGERDYAVLWGQIVQRMAMPRLLGVGKRTHLAADRAEYAPGDRVAVHARLYTPGFDPVDEPAVKGAFGPAGGGAGAGGDVTLKPVPGQPGLYRGEFAAPAAGAYAFRLERDPETKLDVRVAEPAFEPGETAMDEPLLRKMAEASGGGFYREEDLHRLPDAVKGRTQERTSTLEVELWTSPLYFITMMLVLTAEWVLRKRWQLK